MPDRCIYWEKPAETCRENSGWRCGGKPAGVMQAPLLFDGTVRDNVQLGLKLRNVSPEKRRGVADVWMEKLHIRHLADRDVFRALSGGEQQRTSVARALAIQPRLLLLDEPFAALDEPTRKALTGDLRVILQDSGITTVFITHDRLEAVALATHVAVLLQGTLRQKGSVDDVFSHPRGFGCGGIFGLRQCGTGHRAVVAGRHGVHRASQRRLCGQPPALRRSVKPRRC